MRTDATGIAATLVAALSIASPAVAQVLTRPELVRPRLAVEASIDLNAGLGFASRSAIKIYRPTYDSENARVWVASILGPNVVGVDPVGGTVVADMDSGLANSNLKMVLGDRGAVYVVDLEATLGDALRKFDPTGTLLGTCSTRTRMPMQSADYLYLPEAADPPSHATGGTWSRLVIREKRSLRLVGLPRNGRLDFGPAMLTVDEASNRLRVMGFPDLADLRTLRVQDYDLAGNLVSEATVTLPAPFFGTAGYAENYSYDAANDITYFLTRSRGYPGIALLEGDRTVSALRIPQGDADIATASSLYAVDGVMFLVTQGPDNSTSTEGVKGKFAKIGAKDGTKLGTLEIPGKNFNACVDPDHGTLVVTSMDGTWVHVIDPWTTTSPSTTGGLYVAVGTTIDVGNTAEWALRHPTAAEYVYGFNRLGGSQILVYDQTTGGTTAIDVPIWPKWGWIDEDRMRLYAVCHLGTAIAVVDVDPGSPTFHTLVHSEVLRGSYNETDAIGSFAVDPDLGRIFVSHPEAKSVTVFDLATESVTDEWDLSSYLGSGDPGGPGKMQLAYLSSRDFLYVFSKASYRLLEIDLAASPVSLKTIDASAARLEEQWLTNDILYADTAHDTLWIGRYSYRPATGAIVDPLPKETAKYVQQVLAYGESEDVYVVAVLTTNAIGIAIVDAATRTVVDRIQIRPDLTMPPELSYDSRFGQVLVASHNDAGIHIVDCFEQAFSALSEEIELTGARTNR